MNYTSIEQSKKLLELGLSPESADMHYLGLGDIDTGKVLFSENSSPIEVGSPYGENTLSCWSVGVLLELIPMAERGSMELYKDWEYKYTLQNDYYCTPRFNTLIEAAYNMVVWLLENNYIKKEGNT